MKTEELLNSNIYSVIVENGSFTDDIGLYAGEGVTDSSTGTSKFSVACEAIRMESGGVFTYGFLTCAHAFSGSSNVYLYTGASTNTYLGYSPSTLHKNFGKADVAFIITDPNVDLYSIVYMNTITLYGTYTSNMGSTVYKMGYSSGLKSGTVLDSSFSIWFDGVLFSDMLKSSYLSAGGDSGGIVFKEPNSTNCAYPLGIHKGHVNNSSGEFLYSVSTKMKNALDALKINNIPVFLF